MNGTTEHPIFYWHDSPGNRFRVDVADFDEAAECAYCVPVYSAETVDRLRARVAELEAERTDDDALRERMADILKRTAVALRGPEPPLTAWSWYDLPERAAAAIASIYLLEGVARDLADLRKLVPMLVDRFLGWKLPKDFAPDGGITFTPPHPNYDQALHWPTGTCLLNAPQATVMFEHLLGIDGATGEECANCGCSLPIGCDGFFSADQACPLHNDDAAAKDGA